jgi:hypothetical protein
MNNKNYIWIVEAKSSTSKVYRPLFGTFKDTYFSGIYPNRIFARNAAKYMTENNQYNHPRFPLMVKYRVKKYERI